MSAPRIILASLHLSAKNYQNWWKFDEVLTKTILHSFLRHGDMYTCNKNNTEAKALLHLGFYCLLMSLTFIQLNGEFIA